MNISISSNQSDDPNFIEIVKKAIGGMASLKAMEHFAIIRIENWFDDRWVGFPGVFREYQQFYGISVADPRSRSEVLPPFAKNRVLDVFMHGKPNDNLAAVFFFSSNSDKNKRGAILGSFPSEDGSWNWYVGFKLNGDCKAIRHKNIGHNEFNQFVQHGT